MKTPLSLAARLFSAPRLFPATRLLLTSLLLGWALAGCQSLLPAESPQTENARSNASQPLPQDASLQTLVEFSEWLNQQNPGSLWSLYRVAQEREKEVGKPLDQLNLALLISVPGTTFQNNQKALGYLKKAMSSATLWQSEMKYFIRTMQVDIKVREQERLAWQKEVDQQKDKVVVLQQQLQQLKSLEKGLVERLEGQD